MIDVIFLGTSAGIPTRDRNLPAILVKHDKERILFDCGEGTQRQLMSKNLKFMRIDRIFISHWHADHFAGLIGLIQTMSLEGRKRPLYIYGPQKTAEFVDNLLTIGFFARQFQIVARDLEDEEVVEGDGYTVYPFRTKHRIPAYGYVFQEATKVNANMKKAAKFGLKTGPLIGKLKAGKTVEFNGNKIKPEDVLESFPGVKLVYTGDTAIFRELEKHVEGSDLFICDSTFGEEKEARAGAFRHGTAKEAAEIAKKAGAKQLILTHLSRRYQKGKEHTPEDLEAQAKKVFSNSKVAKDFMEIKLK